MWAQSSKPKQRWTRDWTEFIRSWSGKIKWFMAKLASQEPHIWSASRNFQLDPIFLDCKRRLVHEDFYALMLIVHTSWLLGMDSRGAQSDCLLKHRKTNGILYIIYLNLSTFFKIISILLPKFTHMLLTVSSFSPLGLMFRIRPCLI